MIRLIFLLYFPIFALGHFGDYGFDSTASHKHYGDRIERMPARRRNASIEVQRLYANILDSIVVLQYNSIICRPLEEKETKCEKCQCDINGKNYNCVSKLNTYCEEWAHNYKKKKLPVPGSKNFRCNRGDLLPNIIGSCFMCQCAENGRQVQCTYGSETVCVYPLVIPPNPKKLDPREIRPWGVPQNSYKQVDPFW